MENSLWSFGCSFTADWNPLNNTPPNNYDMYREYRGGNLPPVWPTILSQKLNLTNQNKGKGATCNYDIFYSFCNIVSDLNKGDIVVYQWQNTHRFLMANPNKNFLQTILPSQDYSDDYDKKILENISVNRTNEVWIQELVYFTKIINEICKEKGVTIFYWTYFDDVIFTYIKKYWPEFETDLILKSPQKNEYLFQYLKRLTNDKYTIWSETNQQIQDYHLGEIGHKKQAELFYNYIKERI
jgi:hypothetical protein